MPPLKRVGIGLLLTSASFVVSGILEMALEGGDLHPPPSGFGFVTVINNLDQNITVRPKEKGFFPEDVYHVNAHEIMGGSRIKVNLHLTQITHGNNVTTSLLHPNLTFSINNETAIDLERTLEVGDRSGKIAVLDENRNGTMLLEIDEDISKPPDAQVWINLMSANKDLMIFIEDKQTKQHMNQKIALDPGKYGFSGTSKENAVNDKKKQDYKNGGVYTVVFKDGLHNNISNLEYMRYQNTEPNLYPIFWQIPQYVIITMGEIMVSITGLSFAYSQAPDSMKAVLQSGWLFTTFVGNAVVVIVTESQEGSESKLKHSEELFLFAGLCLLCTIIFTFLAMNYTYVNVTDTTSEPALGTRVSPDQGIELDELHNGELPMDSDTDGYRANDGYEKDE